MDWLTQTKYRSRKDQPPNINGRHKTVKHERKKNTCCENELSDYRDGIRHRKMRLAYDEKQKMTECIKLPNQDKIITFEENETYKYLGILEADTI